MSHQVQIDYKHIACQCNTVCNLAEARLQELDKMLEEVESTSTRLLNNQSEELKKAIQKEKKNLLDQIKRVKDKANEDAKLGIVSADSDGQRYKTRNQAIEEASRLEQMVNDLSSNKLIEFKSLMDTLLKESSNDGYRKLLENVNGNVAIDERTKSVLDSISDSTLRQFTYIAYIKDNSLVGDVLLKAGKELMKKSLNSTFESKLSEEEDRIRKELENARVDKEIIKEVVSNNAGSAKEKLALMQEKATKEVIGETVRQQSLKVIMKAIADRGFIVDKKNIKINREKNEVNMVAMKASGERADFKIYMDGRFIYDFHQGYQGQACQKDIEPFMKDLEEVYGIHVTETLEIWKNPDKISTMKYQAINTNKNKG